MSSILPHLKRRLTDLLRKESLGTRLHRVLLRTAIAGIGLVPLGQAAVGSEAPPPIVTPVIVNRDRRTSSAPLVFSSVGQDSGTLLVQHRSHSSHSSHRSHSSHSSHYSSTTVSAPSTVRSSPTTPAISAPVAPGIAPAAVEAVPKSAVTSPLATDSQDIQKLSLTLSSLNLGERYILGKDEFGTEYKVFYTGVTKITTLGTAGTTKAVDTILQEPRGDLSSLLRMNDDLSVIWEKQGAKRMALKITILK